MINSPLRLFLLKAIELGRRSEILINLVIPKFRYLVNHLIFNSLFLFPNLLKRFRDGIDHDLVRKFLNEPEILLNFIKNSEFSQMRF